MTRYVLVGDGSSDRALTEPLRWAIKQTTNGPFEIVFADLRGIRLEEEGLAGRLRVALDLYGSGKTVLLIHRDAERESISARLEEIHEAARAVSATVCVPVVPVRMTEAWLLTNEEAIRAAAGNPNGTGNLSLPRIQRLEEVPDPKSVLYNALCEASGLSGRRLRGFRSKRMRAAVHRVASLTDDYAPLLHLPAYRAFVECLRAAKSPDQ